MPRRLSAGIALTALLAAGCQDYNFNPVGHCLLQPGSERVTLSNLATADILFVVDDSGSMFGEQNLLAANFDTFVNELTATNAERVGNGLEPLDFHIAITTTSVFQATSVGTCRNDCAGMSGALACCTAAGGQAFAQPVYCETNAQCGNGYTCRTDCGSAFANERVCCDATNFPQRLAPQTCTTPGAFCGDVRDRYRGQFETTAGKLCEAGIATPGAPYPAGDFVGAAGNPRVISFSKDLYPTGAPPDQAGIAARVAQFKQNIVVGTCGSGQEQGLEASRLALKKALNKDGLSQPAGVTGWPHPDAKLVVVYIGDEDDCSSPKNDPVVINTGTRFPTPDEDECTNDTTKRYKLADYEQFLRGLGRPFSVAIVESTVCTGPDCTPAVCCGAADNTCTGSETPGFRYVTLANDLRGGGTEVVEGSVCTDFGATLGQIAQLVKPPTGLELPTQPAASEVTLLRITSSDGKTRTTCRGPAPAGTAGAELANYDWWFTATSQATAPSDPSRFVYINHSTNGCEANPGETYSADYLGVVPTGGCADAAECAAVLGGAEADWTCEKPAGAARGTCLCQ